MMVPRGFASSPRGQRQHLGYDEKDDFLSNTRQDEKYRRKQSLSMSVSPPRSSGPRSNPVKIPPRSVNTPTQTPQRPTPTIIQKDPNLLSTSQPARRLQSSPRDVLSATAIPIRRKPKQRVAQRIPDCDYVADFSKLLLDDLKPSGDGSLSGSLTNPQFDGLFGNIDELMEGQMIVGSEGLDSGMLSTRSISSESMPSLATPEDFSNTEVNSTSPSMIRSLSERRMRQVASSECASEHPLMHFDGEEEEDGDKTPDLMLSPPPRKQSKSPIQGKRVSSFKSSLTASLKAIAQSVSNYATTPPAVQPDDFLTHSFFDIQPSLTDDRRPPPSDEPPSPALRRYLNPHTSAAPDSGAQLHFWLDDRPTAAPPSSVDDAKPKLKIKKKYQKNTKSSSEFPPNVPLATCIPPQIRTAHASSPPIWLAPDGTPSNKHTAVTSVWDEAQGLRQREPRENRDFLRVFVCEMEMRRKGKLDEQAPGRAALWLPPVKDNRGKGTGKEKGGEERWRGWGIEDL